MERDDVKKFLAMVQGTYSNFKPVDKTAAVNAWTIALEDFTFGQVQVAFKMYMMSDASGFAPSPGQIIQNIQTITRPAHLNEMEAWSLVSKALRHGSAAEEEFDKLPPIVQRAVGQPSNLRNWSVTDNVTVEGVIQSNFIKTYRAILAQEQQKEVLPKNLQSAIEKVNENREISVNPYIPIEENPRAEGVPMPEGFMDKLSVIMVN